MSLPNGTPRLAPVKKWSRSFRKMDANVPIIVTAPQTKKMADLKKNCPNASTYLMTALHDRATAKDGFGVRSVDCRLSFWLTKASATRAFCVGGLFRWRPVQYPA